MMKALQRADLDKAKREKGDLGRRRKKIRGALQRTLC
jgi:hypothetical protein